jgi:Fanconi anemia group M protein
MTNFHNIFSRQKTIIKKDKPKQTIIADYRERNCLVASNLINLGFEVEFKELKVADYIVKDVAIERKTVSDFLSSMINKRLINQLKELQQYENKLLIIEGIDEQEIYPKENGINPNAVRGFLLSILLKHKVPIIFTKNQKDTAKFISVIANKQERYMSLNVRKKSLNKKEQLQFIIESFPGIGPITSKKLLEKFKTLKNIINAPQEELKEILGKKAEIIKKLIEEGY